MRFIIILISIVIYTNCIGQTHDKYVPFRISDYPKEKFTIKIIDKKFSKFSIKITQVSSRENKIIDSSFFYCRAWLIIKKENKIINKRHYKSIEPVGGCFGLYVPLKQPREDYFIISKFGDYDGSIIIIDSLGKMTEKNGGEFYISKDKRYLFSNYDSDASKLTVFDFSKNCVIYTSTDELKYRTAEWYYQDRNYIANAYDENSEVENQKNIIAIFNLKTNKLSYKKVNKSFLKNINKLKVYNSMVNAKKCDCGDL